MGGILRHRKQVIITFNIIESAITKKHKPLPNSLRISLEARRRNLNSPLPLSLSLSLSEMGLSAKVFGLVNKPADRLLGGALDHAVAQVEQVVPRAPARQNVLPHLGADRLFRGEKNRGVQVAAHRLFWVEKDCRKES